MAVLSLLAVAPFLFNLARCHGVIINAQGDSGSPPSVGFQVDPSIARNCTSISPCQQDTTIIRDAEIKANVVNTCGRTELTGNIDVGENTENAIAAGQVTQVHSGSSVKVTIHQVNADGAGPYTCDLDESSNTGMHFTNLTVTDNVPGANGFSQAKFQAFDINVQMPENFKCEGGSTGNICTIRCRNNALAGPFGGCFPVQQTDVQGAINSPAQIKTAASLDSVMSQVQQDQTDFSAAVKANQMAGSSEAEKNRGVVEAILANKVTTKAFPQQTPEVVNNNGNSGNKDGTNTSSGQRESGGSQRGGGNRGVGGGQRGGRNRGGDAGSNAGTGAGSGAETGAGIGAGNDAGNGAGAGVGTDAGLGATTDAGTDVGTGAGTDVGTGAETDAGTDVGTGAETGAETEAGADGGNDGQFSAQNRRREQQRRTRQRRDW